MTHIDSLCFYCAYLYASTDSFVESGNNMALISYCSYGGKNAGNRRTCKQFCRACDKTIAERKELLNGKDE